MHIFYISIHFLSECLYRWLVLSRYQKYHLYYLSMVEVCNVSLLLSLRCSIFYMIYWHSLSRRSGQAMHTSDGGPIYRGEAKLFFWLCPSGWAMLTYLVRYHVLRRIGILAKLCPSQRPMVTFSMMSSASSGNCAIVLALS